MRRLGQALLLAASLLGGATNARADRIYGAVIMDGARPLPDKGRYQSVKDWDKTISFYKRVYAPKSGYIWRQVASTPRVRVFHLENTKKGRTWDGINIYETGGKVYLYVLKTDEPSKK